MEKISYLIKENTQDGTFYTQIIKVDFESFEKILKEIIKEKTSNFKNYKKYACNGINYANMFLKHPCECEKVYCKNGVKYYLNITTTSFIKYILKNERIKLDKNTILFYSYDMKRKIA